MIVLIFVNPITNNSEKLVIELPVIDYVYYKHICNCRNDSDVVEQLSFLIEDLDCTKEYSCGRVCMTTYPMYDNRLSEFYYYLVKLVNQLLYNEWIDKLIQRHIDNLVFEHNNPIILPMAKPKSRKKSKKNVPNKYVKRVSKDLFTGEDTYEYYNPNNDHEIHSNNPNLLDSLNSSRKKVKRTKQIGVPMSAMTFSFKKK